MGLTEDDIPEELPDIPEGQDIEKFQSFIEENLDERHVSLGVENSGGFEYKASSDGLDWLRLAVKKNNVRFDNKSRAQSGHPYGLILPDEPEN